MKFRYNSETPIKYFFKPDYGTCGRTCFHKIIGLKNGGNEPSYRLDLNSKIIVDLTKNTDGTLQGKLIEGTLDSHSFYYPSYKENATPVKITRNQKNISIEKVDRKDVIEHLKHEQSKMFIF